MDRRSFLQALAAASACGVPLAASRAQVAGALYDVPRFGNVHLLHITDTHAQLLPTHFREPSANLGIGGGNGKTPHLVGEHLLRHARLEPGSVEAHAFTHLDFERAARRYGATGGFAHLATLVKRLRASRPGALLLDGGDSWQGSATALWTEGRDMIAAQKQLGVDLMTAHWEFTYGAARMQKAVKEELGSIEFLAQNVRTADFEDPVFKAYAIRELGGVPVAIIGQAFPYVPIAHPRHKVADWTFGIRERELQKTVDEARAKGARAVVLLSHNGMDVDLKLASRVRGLDAILGGHTHDAVPVPVKVDSTLVTNAGSNGKFVGVLDLEVKNRVTGFRYRLLPVFSNLLPADAAMTALIERERKPFETKLQERLAVTEGLLYRRGNFNGSWDQLILDALMAVQEAELAFSPGFRWGTTLLPGQAIHREQLMDQMAITYPFATVSELTGVQIKAILEDIADNLFNPDPYLQQGGDMVRVGGMTYTCNPAAGMGSRISEMKLQDRPIEPGKTYKVAGWAPVAEGASGRPAWELVEGYLKDRKTIRPRAPSLPRLIGVEHNPGLA